MDLKYVVLHTLGIIEMKRNRVKWGNLVLKVGPFCFKIKKKFTALELVTNIIYE